MLGCRSILLREPLFVLPVPVAKDIMRAPRRGTPGTVSRPRRAVGRSGTRASVLTGPTSPGEILRRRQAEAWWKKENGRIHFSTDPSRPVVLLIHGKGSSSKAWIEPAAEVCDNDLGKRICYRYDHERKPTDGAIRASPLLGRATVNAQNWLVLS
jgi:hypothetical protein